MMYYMIFTNEMSFSIIALNLPLEQQAVLVVVAHKQGPLGRR